jgi:hypothetical protein
LYYNKCDPTYLDSVNLKLKGKNPTIKLFGFFVRYFLFLKNNYFGYWNHFITMQQYKDRKARQRHQYEPKEPLQNDAGANIEDDENKEVSLKQTNAFELSLGMELEDVVAFLPLHLYSSKQKVCMKCLHPITKQC